MSGRIMMLGPIGHGKTTLIQKLEKQKQSYKKTQDIIYTNKFIDTPGEFVQHRHFNNALQVTSMDAKLICFVLNALVNYQIYSPGYANSFNKPVIGILTHVDKASEEQINNGKSELNKAGCKEIFCVSTITDEGMDLLKKRLKCEE